VKSLWRKILEWLKGKTPSVTPEVPPVDTGEPQVLWPAFDAPDYLDHGYEGENEMRDRYIAAAKAAGYVNAGTCEFLLDRDGQYYFLEMNTRIQVEHPVTELVMGIDLVQWQIRIAAGEVLPFDQRDLVPRGWAMECRITSEDPANGFLPSTGRVEYLHLPSGPGVRWDGGIEAGSDVGLHYDPMLAKLIVHAPTRPLAIARMRRALLELTIDGIETSRSFHVRVMDDPEFQAGAISIQWLEQRLSALTAPTTDHETLTLAAISAALVAHDERTSGRVAPSAANAVAGTMAKGAAITEGAFGWAAVARREALRRS
jgi:acetyl-CoA carboxylase biotin carboxylase subunit